MKPYLLAISPGQGFEASTWARVIRSGIDGLMIREAQLDARPLLELVRWCQREAPQVELWVRGRLDVALAAGCGLHAPEAYPSVPAGRLPLSRPLHAIEDFADRSHAQQLLLSPVFPVPGKGRALGPEGLHALLDRLPPFSGRLLALGGIQAANAVSLRHPRLQGFALIRALWESSDPAALVRSFREN